MKNGKESNMESVKKEDNQYSKDLSVADKLKNKPERVLKVLLGQF